MKFDFKNRGFVVITLSAMLIAVGVINYQLSKQSALTVSKKFEAYEQAQQDKNTDKDELLDSVTIDNIKVTKQPAKGVVKVFMPNSLEGRTFTYDASYLEENGLAYKGGKTSNPKT